MSEEVTGADASLETEGELDLNDLAAVEAASKEDKPVPEATESEAESPPAEEENLEKKTDPFKERIDKLTGRWRETQRELALREEELARLQRQLDEAPKPHEPSKTLKDFDYDENAFQEHLFDRARELAREEARVAVQGMQSEQKQQETVSEYSKREATFAEQVNDYHDVVYDRSLRISQPMAEAIRVLDEGPEIAYWLGKHPDEAAEIASVAPAVAGIRIAEIRANLLAEKGKGKKSVSDAPPPPPKKIGGNEPGRKVSTTSAESDKLSDREWFELEEARKAKLMGR